MYPKLTAMKPAFLFLFCLLVFESFSQTIKRWPNGKTEMTSKRLTYAQHSNIFDEFSWTYPDIKSTPISFTDNKTTFQFGGKTYIAQLNGDKKIKIVSGEIEKEGDEMISNGKMYYNKSSLKLKAVTQNVWTSRTVMSQQSVPVQRSRSVTSYSYQNGRSVPVYRTEYYTVYESRPVTKTEWYYAPRTTYVIDIPNYPYFSFKLTDNIAMVIYKAGDDKYYVQNTAYMIATGDDKINHVFIDANSDGDFFDDDDRVMFNSWNPYSASSAFRSAGAFRDNKWYDVGELRQNKFLTFSSDEATHSLNIDYENSKYVEEDDKGKVLFRNIPEDAKLFVNGKEYHVKRGEKKFKSQYGKFLLRITQKGYVDFEKTYTVDATHPDIELNYTTPTEAGSVRLFNIYEPNFSITVSNNTGYSRTYTNEFEFSAPVGKNIVSVYSNGFTLNYEAEIAHNETVAINFEDEVNKLKKDTPSETDK